MPEKWFGKYCQVTKLKRIKKTANSWIKYAENEEIRVKNLALRRDFIQQSKSKSKNS